MGNTGRPTNAYPRGWSGRWGAAPPRSFLTEDEIKTMLDESDREGWAEVLGDEVQ